MLNKDLLPTYLALITTVGYITIVGLLMFHEVPAGSHDVVMQMSGVLATTFGGIIGYYFGSSAGSAKKTEIMAIDNKKV